MDCCRSERDDHGRGSFGLGDRLWLRPSRANCECRENERAERKRQYPCDIVRPQGAGDRAGQQPHEVHQCNGQSDPLMSHLSRQQLEAVGAVRLGDPLAPQKASDDRESRIHGEYPCEDQQRPGRGGVVNAAGESDHGEDEAEIAAADIAEEDLRGRPVPQQKAQRRAADHDGGRGRVSDAEGKQTEYRGAEGHEHRLRARDTVDAIHEVVHVQEPHDPDRGKTVDQSLQQGSAALEIEQVDRSDAQHGPAGRHEVNK